jgi:pimeloyl-ACP methyl ester carboxylesterase
VNGEERQNATIEDLIFSIPFLIKTLSEGQTLQAGDVLATGTPAGVGIGKKPPVFLKPGDVVEVSVTGLGTLRNTIAESSAKNQTIARLAKNSHIPVSNLNKTCGGVGLTSVNGKPLHYRKLGTTGSPIIFIHGLGGSSEYYSPLIAMLKLAESHSVHLVDLEGHGLSPTSAASSISISSYASDIQALMQQASVNGATVVAHSMGCLVALDLALKAPELVSKLVLLGPPPSPLPEAGRNGSVARAKVVRESGMSAVVDAIITAGTSAKSKAENLVGIAAVRLSLLGQDPEGYAKGCTALAGASEAIPVNQIKATTLIVTGDEDKVSPPSVCEKMAGEIKGARVEVLPGVGHWHLFEDVRGVSAAVKSFL